MPTKTVKSKKITGASIEELSAILQENQPELQPSGIDLKKTSALSRIKARSRSLSTTAEGKPEKAEISNDGSKAEQKAEEKDISGSATKKLTKTGEDKSESSSADSTATVEAKQATAEKKPSTEKKATAEKKPSTEKKATAEKKPSTEKKSTAEKKPSIDKKSTVEKKSTAKNKSEASVTTADKSAAAKSGAAAARNEEGEASADNTAKKKEASRSTAAKKVNEINEAWENEELQSGRDITLGELLERAEIQEEVRDGRYRAQTLRNISGTIRADSSRRKKSKNDAALVMASLGGSQDRMIEAEAAAPSTSGFPIDVSHIDFERERFDAEQECIEEFRETVLELAQVYEVVDAEFIQVKDHIIEELSEADREAELKTTELKAKQKELVNHIAELQELILTKKSELAGLGFAAFYKKSKLKQLIAESQNEISQLEMEALTYNARLISIVDEAAKNRKSLFEKIERARASSEQAQSRLDEARAVLEKMEKRIHIDENAVHKKLILNALRIYPKPMTIGQLLYYPGLSGYSVQKMSSAINQLVNNDKLVLKVALEDNVYYLIANTGS